MHQKIQLITSLEVNRICAVVDMAQICAIVHHPNHAKQKWGDYWGRFPLLLTDITETEAVVESIYMHHYTQIYAPRCREQIPDVRIGSARDEQLIGSDKIRVQLYTRWCIWTQLYLCTIWCIICTAYGPNFKPIHLGPIVHQMVLMDPTI